jgi:beta-galactosidase GanA
VGSDGTKYWASEGIVFDLELGRQEQFSACDTGSFFMTWITPESGTYEVFAQFLNQNGNLE